MNLRGRQRLLKVVGLASKHSSYANAIGIKVGIHSENDKGEFLLSLSSANWESKEEVRT